LVEAFTDGADEDELLDEEESEERTPGAMLGMAAISCGAEFWDCKGM